jgi:16S rRNA (adenine1518-N6/adenine1519-N6)-dimethyltransferase
VNKSEITSTLESLGASARKSLGQNFLHDKNMANWIVGQLDLSPGEHVVEVGPGLGSLTSPIIGKGLSATLLEKDKKFAAYLRAKYDNYNTHVIEGDALNFDVRELFPLAPVKLAGNLPYYVSSQLLFHFLDDPSPFERAVITIQRELGDRLAASPGNKIYGALSILIQSRWNVSRLRVLPPSVFYPEPQIDSAVLLLTPKRMSVPFSFSALQTVVRSAFAQRRKQLRKGLLQVANVETVNHGLHVSGISGESRAEQISCEEWINLSNALFPKEIHDKGAAELLQVVDGLDRPVMGKDRMTVHRENLLHRAVHVLTWNSKNELFLQKRSYRKDNFPGLWDSSSSGHVDVDESYENCAVRELREELDLSAQLREIATIPASERTGFEFIKLYSATTDQKPRTNPWEIESGAFFPKHVIDRWIERRPQDFASGFLECYKHAQN